MSLSSILKSDFHATDRKRGKSYHQSGLVSAMDIGDGLLMAEVRGSYGTYDVVIDVSPYGKETDLSCSCPRYIDGYNCKHIWAAILEFDLLYGDGSEPNLTTKSTRKTNAKRVTAPAWRTLLHNVARDVDHGHGPLQSPFETTKNQISEVIYTIDAAAGKSYGPNEIALSILHRAQKKDGQWGKLKSFNFSHDSVGSLPNPADREIANRLLGVDRNYSDPYGYGSVRTAFSKFDIDSSWSNDLGQLLTQTGRLFWTLDMSLPLEDFYPINLVEFSTPATIRVDIVDLTTPKHAAEMKVALALAGNRIENERIVKIADNGIALLQDRLIKIANPESIGLWQHAHVNPPITIKKAERNDFLAQLSSINGLPPVNLPESWQIEQTKNVKPIGVLKLTNAQYSDRDLAGEIRFDYGGSILPLTTTATATFDDDQNCWSERSPEEESRLLSELMEFPIMDATQNRYVDYDFQINKKNLVRVVDELGELGWKIHLLGKPIKQAGDFNITIDSGVDWFDLSANVVFDGETIQLPKLLQAISKKENFITLADGSQGRIPAKMIEKYARIAKFGKVEDDKIRFHPTQAMLLDAMLESQNVTVDTGFQKLRKKLKSFTGVKPKSAPRTFKGTLRKYQKDGLGWLHFLREFQFGGCLADDMGLGKTIQVLALLESRRTRRVTNPSDTNTETKTTKAKTASTKKQAAIVTAAALLKRKPSIVIVPKSLIFNWIEEASKFTPKLRFHNYTGTDRKTVAADSDGFDVLITTYGTMRKDIGDLCQIEFDYAILDESQAIKNSKALCAKSSRLIRADHRLAMTGTPIENHLGELWSLFEFLNPGMLGGSTNFAKLTNQKKNNEDERAETLSALSRAIQPFMLRRTKEQVLTDLPPKTEQTLYCDMLPAQKKAYDELKEYYRVKLAKKVETVGIGRSKIQVLEALLRLRQVACDPRLLNADAKPGAKLELLQQQMNEIISEGHKVLVFSQFTSLLSLVKQQFDDDGIKYEYLDGKTSKRAECVKRFQEDESVSAFLISIKAGGHGLNLTSADYVFLLDPWWNPAVEAQAIDRAHRMGQKNRVIAYRMICRDTVEEKIVELQKSKRDLADTIIQADESLIRTLTADDLQTLFE